MIEIDACKSIKSEELHAKDIERKESSLVIDGKMDLSLVME